MCRIMWWVWPHLRWLWAWIGTVTAGLFVSWLYSLLSEQPLPHVRVASALLHHDWPWITLSLMGGPILPVAVHRARQQPGVDFMVARRRTRQVRGACIQVK